MKRIFLAGILKNIQSVVDLRNLPKAPIDLLSFFRDKSEFTKHYDGKYQLRILPIFFDRSKSSKFDPHYVFQSYWATKNILLQNPLPKYHIDLSSSIPFLIQLSAVLPVIQIEYRPPNLSIPSCKIVVGNILKLPIASSSLNSISCLHVVEHIGLGRYGDPVDPMGCWHALAELQRITASKGNLYLSVPVGKPAIYFNAGVVFHAFDIVKYLNGLELIEFSYVDDDGRYFNDQNIYAADNFSYALGLFHFRKL